MRKERAMTKEQKNARSLENYYFLKSMHICTACGNRKAELNKTKCYICSEKERMRKRDRIRNMSNIEKEQSRKTGRQRAKARYEKMKTEGLCASCGTHRAVKGQVYCLDCKIKRKKKRDEKNRGKIARSERSAYGLCYVCGEELGDDGRKICSKCSERALKNLKSCTGAIHPWRKDNCMVFLRKDGE